MSTGSGYILRINGKQLGPFSLAQLQSFRDKGKLRPEHELTVDRERWFPASRVPELFPQSEAPPTYAFATEEPAPPAAEIEWYVEIDGDRRGPITPTMLRSLIAAGKVEEGDLVWRSGLRDWQPAEDFPELFEGQPGPPAESARKRREADANGIGDRFLNALRTSVTEKDLERICQSMLLIGRVSLAIGAVAIASYMACRAVVLNDLSLGGFAALTGAVLLAFQYVGQRMSRAAHRLASASTYRLSSNAFPNSVAMLLMATGLFLAAAGVLSQIGRVETGYPSRASDSDAVPIIISIVVGIEILLPFLYAAHAALHPKWSNVDCSTEVCAGEEGIGCVAFLLKMGLRLVPIVFGVSGSLGALGAIAAVALFAAGPPLRLDSIPIMSASLTSLVTAAVFPMLWYLQAALLSAILDFMGPSLRSSTSHGADVSAAR